MSVSSCSPSEALRPTEAQIKELCDRARDIFVGESNVHLVHAPVTGTLDRRTPMRAFRHSHLTTIIIYSPAHSFNFDLVFISPVFPFHRGITNAYVISLHIYCPDLFIHALTQSFPHR